jgi:hypothetical protein
MLAGVGIIGALASILASMLVPPPNEPAGEAAAAVATEGGSAVEPGAATGAVEPVMPAASAEAITAELAALRAEVAALRSALAPPGS